MRSHLFLFLAIFTAPGMMSASEADEEIVTDESAEEIIITGDRTVFERLKAAEERTYSIFNELNNEDRFDVICATFTSTGSHLKGRSCTPQFILEARRSEAIDYKRSLGNYLDPFGALPDGSVSPELAPAEAMISAQMPKYQAKMKQIAEEHPEFLQSLIQYSELKAEYENSKAEK